MFAIRYISSLWNNYINSSRPDDVPVDDEPASPLAQRQIEALDLNAGSGNASSKQVVIYTNRPMNGTAARLPDPKNESSQQVIFAPTPPYKRSLSPILEADVPKLLLGRPSPLHVESSERGTIAEPIELPDSAEQPLLITDSPHADPVSPSPQYSTARDHEQIQLQEAMIAEWRAEFGPRVDDLVSTRMQAVALSPAEIAGERARIHGLINNERSLAIQEETFNALREQFGAERVNQILAETPDKIYTGKDIQVLFKRLTAETRAENNQFRTSLSQYGSEVDHVVPRRAVLLTAAQKADAVTRLEFFGALKRQFDARAVDAVLPEYRAKAVLTQNDYISLLAKVGQRHYALLEQDQRIQQLSSSYGKPAERESGLLTPEAMAEKEARLALASLSDEDRQFLVRLAEDDVSQLTSVAQNPEAFLKFAEETIADAGRQRIPDAHFRMLMAANSGVACGNAPPVYHQITADTALLQRLQAAKNLPIKARIAILREILARVENANQFWTAARERFELIYPKARVKQVIDSYFSRYAEGLQPLRQDTLDKIEWVLQRQNTAMEIEEACTPLLLLSQTDGANHPIDTELMKEAIEVQLDFERNLRLREEYDLTYSLCGLIHSEILLLESLQTMSEAQIKEFLAQLNPKEKALIAGIEKKATAQKITFAQALEETLHGHRALLQAKQEMIVTCRRKIEDDLAPNLLRPAIDALSPNGWRMRYILSLANFRSTNSPLQLMSLFESLSSIISRSQAPSRVYLEEFRIDVALGIFRATGNHGPVELLLGAIKGESEQANIPEERVERLKHYSFNLTQGMARIAQELSQSQELSPFMRAFHVVPLGNVLFRGVHYNEDTEKDEFTPPTGKWAVVDLRHLPEAHRAAIVKQLSPERLQELLKDKQPYEAVSFDLVEDQLVVRPDKQGAVRIFYESPKITFVNHEDRDFGQRSRLVRKSRATRDSQGNKWPDLQHGDYARLKKEPLKKAEAEWSKSRMMTAAVDRQIVIQGARVAAEAVLRGASEGLYRDHQHLREFYDAVNGSDVAKMAGSYAEDPIFNDSTHLFMHQGQRLAGVDRTRVPLLSGSLDDARKRSREMESLMQVGGITAFYRAWIQDIRTMQQIAKENEAFRDQFNWFLSEVDKVLPHVERFLSRFPAELLQLEQIMQAIQDETRRFPEAATVMERFGKSPEQIRQMLSTSLAKIPLEFKLLKMAFKDLQVAESSARVQQERNDRLMKLFPANGPLRTAIGNAIGRILNGMTKVTLALDEILRKNITELSPLHEEVADAYAGASEQIFQSELLRSQEKQKKMSGMNEHQAVASFFPPPPPKKKRVVASPPVVDLEMSKI